jgi:hypothetical protein
MQCVSLLAPENFLPHGEFICEQTSCTGSLERMATGCIVLQKSIVTIFSVTIANPIEPIIERDPESS